MRTLAKFAELHVLRSNSTSVAHQIASALRARPDLVGELEWHLAAIATFMANVETLSMPIRELEKELAASSSRRKPR